MKMRLYLQQYEVDTQSFEFLDAFVLEDTVRNVKFVGVSEAISTLSPL